ncbi:hypothetical protein Fcan01_08898 [Folsomia candida]|uniref:Uncharacterized protein n=1 Tax=Folsomia candida TaxID=158441 RepID=A0A226EEA3_FOLCA|nr:hypothetical protein Fcan01_08898 [Folsomia candida]
MKFNPSTQIFVGTPKLRKLQLYGCLLVTLQMIINFWQTHKIYTEYPGGSHNPDFHICFAFTFITVFALFPLWLVYFKQEEMKNGFNRVLKYSVQFQEGVEALLSPYPDGIHVKSSSEEEPPPWDSVL